LRAAEGFVLNTSELCQNSSLVTHKYGKKKKQKPEPRYRRKILGDTILRYKHTFVRVVLKADPPRDVKGPSEQGRIFARIVGNKSTLS